MRGSLFLLRLSFFCLLALCPQMCVAQTTAFTYQGTLTDAGSPANGNYDLQFKLFDTSGVGTGTQQGATITNPTVAVSNGVFTVTLDFGANVFTGAERYLEIGGRPAGSGSAYTLLTTRQPITSVPYAIRSLRATSADTATTATNATNATNATTAQDALQLGGVPANQYVFTGDVRLADARQPLPNSANYIQNTNTAQASSNFNIGGNGTIGGNLIASGNVGIGTTAPTAKLDVNGNTNLAGNLTIGTTVLTPASGMQIGSNPNPSSGFSGANAGLTIVGNAAAPAFLEVHNKYAVGADFYSHDDAQFRAPYLSFFKSRGTQIAPTAVKYTRYEEDSIGGINFGGWDGATYFAGSAAIYTQPDEDWTPTSHGGHLSIYGTNIGGGHTQQIAQFGGLDPTGNGTSENIIFYRPLTWGGNLRGNPGIFPRSNPAVLAVRNGDNSADAALTVGTLTASGNVGIGTSAPTQKLHVVGNIFATGTITPSDARYKQHIQPLSQALNKVQRMRGVSYDWRLSEYPQMGFSAGPQLGFIAQDLRQVLPEAVHQDAQGMYSVNYNSAIPLLVEAVKEQQQQIEQLRKELRQLRAVSHRPRAKRAR